MLSDAITTLHLQHIDLFDTNPMNVRILVWQLTLRSWTGARNLMQERISARFHILRAVRKVKRLRCDEFDSDKNPVSTGWGREPHFSYCNGKRF